MKCKDCNNAERCIYRNLLDKGELCIEELDDYIKNHPNNKLNITGIPDILLSSIRQAVTPLMLEISKYMNSHTDRLIMSTPAGQFAIGANLESDIRLKWKRLCSVCTEKDSGMNKEVFRFSRSRKELQWVKKGEYTMYYLPVEVLKNLPIDGRLLD